MSKITFERLLEINQGADLTDAFIWKIDGVPVDLTGASARSQLRRTHASAGVVADWSTTNGKLVLGTTDGKVGYKVPKADTAAISGEGVYDFVITFATGTVVRLIEGEFHVNPGVTQ